MKTDFKKLIETYSATPGEFSVVTVPALQFLMVDGHGDPNTSQLYKDALTTIYPVAFKLRFLSKNMLGHDYTVMPLEAVWWAEDMASFTEQRDKTKWSWTLLCMVPEWITLDHFDGARDAIAGKGAAPMLSKLRLEILDEGLCVQTLHVGSYDDEAAVIGEMHSAFIPDNKLQLTGRHHEIYLNDPRRTAPEKLRTLLRQPVRRQPATM